MGDIAVSSDPMFSFFWVLDSFGFLQDNVVGEVNWSVSVTMVAIEDVEPKNSQMSVALI